MAKNHPNSTSLRLGEKHMKMLDDCQEDMDTSQVGVVRHLLEKKHAAIVRKMEKSAKRLTLGDSRR